MSAAANWSYTATATLWVLSGRDDLSGALTFEAPVAVLCDYMSEAKRAVDSRGVEFTSALTLYTEHPGIKQDDRIILGRSAEADPIALGAVEVRSVARMADTFDRAADDYKVMTA